MDLEAIQVIQEGPHRVCIQTGANDRMDLVVAMQVILDLDQTQVHRAISVGVVIPAVIPVASQVVAIQAVIPVASQVAGITMVVAVVIIQEAEAVAIQEAEAEEVAIQEGI